MPAGTRAVSAVPEAFGKKQEVKGGFHFQRRTWRPRALNCLFTVKTNSNTKDSLFLKTKSSKNPARGPGRLWYIERVYFFLFHIKAYFPILPRASESERNTPSPREESAYSLCSFLMYRWWEIILDALLDVEQD